MDAKEIRHKALLDLIESFGYISLKEASRELKVSEQTVRRDVFALSNMGKVKRTHGGAAFAGALDHNTYRERQLSQPTEKISIARAVADIISDGATVFLDSGTTCEAIASALLARKNLRVITYSIKCAALLISREDFTIAIPSGIIRHVDGAIVGPHGDSFVEQFSFDAAIIAVSGLDNNGRLADDDAFEVNRVRAAMKQAQRTILALTSDKIGITGLVKLADLDEIDLIVVQGAPSKELKRLTRNKHVRLVHTN